MEGRWRGAPPVGAMLACAAVAAGCGSTSSGASGESIDTKDPATAFAPLVRIGPQESWRPVGARWFLERSVLGFAEDRGCADRKIAVGRTLEEQRTAEFDWLFVTGIGSTYRNYWRNPYAKDCELKWGSRVYPAQNTRPFDEGDRPKGLRPGQGYYLDLVNDARRGPRRLSDARVYVERTAGDDSELRLTYWILHGMNHPPGQPKAVHEGDWERLDVLLEREGGDSYVPEAVRFHEPGGGSRDLPWDRLALTGGTHPTVVSARGSHTLTPARRRAACAGCVPWRTWTALSDARKQLWYGFGGAWGEVGTTRGTTGPHGPHATAWPSTKRIQLLPNPHI
jgi:hypothetical protein